MNVITGHFNPRFDLMVDLEVKLPQGVRNDVIEAFVNDDVSSPLMVTIEDSGRSTHTLSPLPFRVRSLRLDPVTAQFAQVKTHSVAVVTSAISWDRTPITLSTFDIEKGASVTAINLSQDGDWLTARSNDPALFFNLDTPLDLYQIFHRSRYFFSNKTLLLSLCIVAVPLCFLFCLSQRLALGLLKAPALDFRSRAIVHGVALSLSLVSLSLLVAAYQAVSQKLSSAYARARFDLLSSQDLEEAVQRLMDFEVLTPSEARVDVRSVVAAKGRTDLTRIRKELRAAIWKGGTTPDRLPNRVEATPPLFESSVLAETRSLDIEMELGITSHARFLNAANPRGCLLIYHDGHQGVRNSPYAPLFSLFEQFLARGCNVMALSMPLFGENPATLQVTLPDERVLELKSHEDFAELNKAGYSALRFFMEPIRVGINFALTQPGGAGDIAMVGLSGGGWATMVAGAIDSRVRYLYPVASLLPVNLRRQIQDCATLDFEQRYLSEHLNIDYFTLLLLGIEDPRSRALYTFIKYDTGCYRGEKTAAFSAQVEAMAEELRIGSIRFAVDDSISGHLVSAEASDRIVRDFFAGVMPLAADAPHYAPDP